MAKRNAIIPVERVQRCILLIRNQKVILDRDLASLYGVETRDLNKAVTRNIERFPSDFMFKLNTKEFENLKFHFGTSSWGGTRKPPRAFPEQGIAMLSGVLRSKQAIKVNIAIMRVFVRLREILADNAALRRRIENTMSRLNTFSTYWAKCYRNRRNLLNLLAFTAKRLDENKIITHGRLCPCALGNS
jgi:hypothetical protein